MITRFKRYLGRLFLFCPRSKQVLDFKEELLGTMTEHYRDQLKKGLSEEESYKSSIALAEGYRQVVSEMEKKTDGTAPAAIMDKAQILLMLSGLYFLAVAIGYLSYSLIFEDWSAWWLFPFAGLVYGLGAAVMAFKYAYKKSIYQLVRAAILLTTMLITVIVFLAVSFATDAWAITWVSFLIGLIVWLSVDMAFRVTIAGAPAKILHIVGITSLATVTLYYTVSFFTQAWGKSWLIFLGGVFVILCMLFLEKYNSMQNKAK